MKWERHSPHKGKKIFNYAVAVTNGSVDSARSNRSQGKRQFYKKV